MTEPVSLPPPPPLPGPPAFAELIDLLFSGVSERPMWHGFLMALGQQPGVTLACLVLDGQGGEIHLGAADPAQNEAIAASLDIAALRSMAPGRAQAVTSHGPSPVISAGLRIALTDDRSAWLLLGGDPNGQAAQYSALLDGLAPYAARILPFYINIGSAERLRLIAEYVLETSGVGVIVVEPDALIVSANATATAIMGRTRLMQIRDHRLATSNADDTRLLRTAIAEMAERQGPRPDPSCYASVALTDVAEGQRLTLIIRPGPPYGPMNAPLRRTAVVILRDPALPATLSAQDLAQLFGLTPAEARLASLLADGEGLDEAAVALGVARNTARSQLQAIYAKTGVNRQGDLVRLLLSSAASHARKRG